MTVVRYRLTISLVTDAPLHTGGVDEEFNADKDEFTPRKIACDGVGREVLTGRSVKGAIRAAFEQLRDSGVASQVDVKDWGRLAQLWGGLDRASALTFHSVDFSMALRDDKGDRLPPRPGIAVDRYWGTAADTALFGHELIPSGTAFDLVITAQAGAANPLPDTEADTQVDPGPDSATSATKPPTPEEVEKLLSILLGLFSKGWVSFGARQNVGWGKVKLAGQPGYRLEKWDLGSTTGLQKWLQSDNPNTNHSLPDAGVPASKKTTITIEWSSPSGILVAAGVEKDDEAAAQASDEAAAKSAGGNEPADGNDGENADRQANTTFPLHERPGDDQLLVLPGSSVRGALRSRATVIARTILAALGDQLPDWEMVDVHKQLMEDSPLIRALFGTTEHRGALRVFDTLATRVDRSPMIVTHNAGDRWTGGVAKGALYREQVHQVKWHPIEIEIDHRMLVGNPSERRAAMCLLGLVLAELSTGTLPLGSRGTRGMGQVQVRQVRIKSGGDIGDFKGDFASKPEGETVAEQLLKMLKKVADEIDGEWWTYLCEPKKGESSEQ